jgi:hypothetical protein
VAEQLSTETLIDTKLPEIPYPPAPWRSTGQLWMGIFPTDTDVPLPPGLTHVLNPRRVAVMLVRYLEGTLQYDELVIGVLARRGLRFGIWVDYIWVDSLESVWGGRRIWGLPKDMAEFTWTENQVEVSDRHGAIMTLSVAMNPSKWPALWMPAPGFGRLEQQWLYTTAGVWVHPGNTEMHIKDWSSRFAYRPEKSTPSLSFSAKPFRMNVPAPAILPAK